MTSLKVSKNLLNLSEIDHEITVLSNKKTETADRLESLVSELAIYKERLELCSAAYKEALERKQAQEESLKEEEQKVLDRRKQLSEVGGAKSAKLVEREIDIAARTLQMLKENVTKAEEQVDQLQGDLDGLKEKVASLQEQYQEQSPECQSSIKEVEKEISALDKKRDKQLDALEDRVRNLYTRVQSRYKADPVALAAKNSCRSCYRALPHQTYNQVLAGNSLIQCPGCSRILVHVGE